MCLSASIAVCNVQVWKNQFAKLYIQEWGIGQRSGMSCQLMDISWQGESPNLGTCVALHNRKNAICHVYVLCDMINWLQLIIIFKSICLILIYWLVDK